MCSSESPPWPALLLVRLCAIAARARLWRRAPPTTASTEETPRSATQAQEHRLSLTVDTRNHVHTVPVGTRLPRCSAAMDLSSLDAAWGAAPPVGVTILVSDEALADGSFLVHYFVALVLRSGARVLWRAHASAAARALAARRRARRCDLVATRRSTLWRHRTAHGARRRSVARALLLLLLWGKRTDIAAAAWGRPGCPVSCRRARPDSVRGVRCRCARSSGVNRCTRGGGGAGCAGRRRWRQL